MLRSIWQERERKSVAERKTLEDQITDVDRKIQQVMARILATGHQPERDAAIAVLGTRRPSPDAYTSTTRRLSPDAYDDPITSKTSVAPHFCTEMGSPISIASLETRSVHLPCQILAAS
jgi:hypothetical protein